MVLKNNPTNLGGLFFVYPKGFAFLLDWSRTPSVSAWALTPPSRREVMIRCYFDDTLRHCVPPPDGQSGRLFTKLYSPPVGCADSPLPEREGGLTFSLLLLTFHLYITPPPEKVKRFEDIFKNFQQKSR